MGELTDLLDQGCRVVLFHNALGTYTAVLVRPHTPAMNRLVEATHRLTGGEQTEMGGVVISDRLTLSEVLVAIAQRATDWHH